MAAENENAQIVAWDDKFATGIELIDDQHKELVKLTNNLYRACLGGSDEAGVVFMDSMNLMLDYVRFHFGAEQKLMTRINYPDYEGHKEQHDTLVKDVHETIKNYNSGKEINLNQLVVTLKDWIINHIAGTDMLYVSFIAEQKEKGLLTDQQVNG